MGAHHVEHVMGMVVSLDVRGDVPGVGRLVDTVARWLHWVDATFSTFKDDSVISRIASGALPESDAPAMVRRVLERCDELRDVTNGYFDARFGGRLDPAGFVKGWSVEVASALLVAGGADRHCVNAGGDIRTRGEPEPGRPWHVGVAHPLVRDALCTTVTVRDGAVATSGTAERGAHLVDPHTGRPSIDLASVTVVGPDLATADAYATAAFVMGFDAPEWLAGLDGYEAYVVDAGGMEWATDGFVRAYQEFPAGPSPSS